MISKPLFKQSCKANAGIWGFVTGITCFILAALILVLGNLNVSGIRDSMSNMFISNTIESTIQEQSMTYFNMTDTALDTYNSEYAKLKDVLLLFTSQTEESGDSQDDRQNIINSYNTKIAEGKTNDEAIASVVSEYNNKYSAEAIGVLIKYYNDVKTEDYTPTYSDAEISAYVLGLVAAGVYQELQSTAGEETAEEAEQFISSAIEMYLDKYAENSEISTTDFAIAYIPTVLSSLFADQSFDYNGREIKVSDYFTAKEIETTSQAAIASFRSQLAIKEAEIRKKLLADNPEYAEDEDALNDAVNDELSKYINSVISSLSKSLLESIPADVAQALSELGTMDIYAMVIGSMFYKIAGLLLPIIFIIMTANNLIASQVDSGSMAYVLSTPTKRKKVTITQMTYLLVSLLIMFILTTVVGEICLAIVGTEEFTITYSQLALLSVGAFITTAAISGICFLASSWFNRSKLAISVGGGLSMFFLVATILGLFGSSMMPSAIRIDAMNYFNYVSIISLFDTASILEGTTTYIWKLAILAVVAIVTYSLAIWKFDKKDLPL